jgi:hypothetical protein
MLLTRKIHILAFLLIAVFFLEGCNKEEKEVLQTTKELLNKQVLYIEKSEDKYVQYIFKNDKLISYNCLTKKESL